MRKIIFMLILGISSIVAKSQVTVNLDSSNIGGVKFRKAASFECMIWNERTHSVTIQWRVDIFGHDSAIIKTYKREQIADNSIYVSPVDGGIFGNYDSLVAEFGVPDSLGVRHISDSTKNNHLFPIGEYTFYQRLAANGTGVLTINDLITIAALRRKQIFE